jgi:hypothetical protein
MAAKKKVARKREFRFYLTVHGYVKAGSLEEAEEALDFATDTEDLRLRGITITGRTTNAEAL